MAFKKLTLGKDKSKSPSFSKFQKRSEETLQKTFNERNKQSKGSSGKSIFNQDKLLKYGIEVFPLDTKKEGQYYFNILPQSFDKDIAAHEDVPVHYQCGLRNDAFICMEAYTEGKQICHRCTVQKEGWRKYDKNNKKEKDKLVSMYYKDRVIYLLEDLGPKYLKDEEPSDTLYIRDLPKSAHAKIQDEVRDKKTGKMLDIADIEDDGKIVYMKITIKADKQGNSYPEYSSFDLMDRDFPINPKIMKKLEQLIEDAQEEDMTAIQYLLHFPDNDEIKESMDTEINVCESSEDEEEEEKTKKKGDKKSTKKDEKKEDEINIEELEIELNEMKTTFQIKRFAKENGIEDAIEQGMDRDDMIEAILIYISEQQG